MTEDDERETPQTEDEATDAEGILTPARRRSLRRVANVVGVLVLLAIVIPFLLYAVPQLIGAEYSYVVLSGSMQPTMGPGDVTFVDEVGVDAVEQGDVINFKRAEDERTTTHRVIEVVERDGERAFRTKGDNNEDPDQGVVTADEFRGRVMHVGGLAVSFPLVGYMIQFASTRTGFSLLFIVPVTLLIANEIWNVVSSARSTSSGAVEPDGGAPGNGEEGTDARTAASDVLHEGDGGTESDGDDESGDSSGGGVAFSPAELRFGLAILAAFVAYSAWVAYSDPTALTIGVAGSATVALVMVGGLYALGSTTSDEEETPARSIADRDGLVIHAGAVPTETESRQREDVSSLETLLAIAENSEGDLGRDPDEGTYHLSAGSTLYVYEPSGEVDGDGVADGGIGYAGERTDLAVVDSTGAAGPADGAGRTADAESTTEADDD